MKRRIAFILISILCLSLLMPAQAELKEGSRPSRLMVVEEGVEFTVSKMQEWTFVTPENLEEHIDMIISLGEKEEDIRARFADGTILFEGYHKNKDRLRAQIFEDAFTRSVWKFDDLTSTQERAVLERLKNYYFQGFLDLYNITTNGPVINGRYIAYPPYTYESGKFCLCFFNGKAYLMTGSDNAIYLKGEKLKAVADLMPDERLILNAHSGEYTFAGISEKKANVKVMIGDQQWDAVVDAEGKYTASIQLQPGDNEIIAIANKEGLSENTLSHFISVDDGMAALTLTEYPYGDEIRNKIKVAGTAAPGAKVTVKIDENEPMELTVNEDGSFSQKIEAEEWVEHSIEITASEEGKEDCTAIFSFTACYEDAAKGISAYRKTLTQGLTYKKISKDPEAHMGGRIKLDVYTREIEHTDGRLIIKGNVYTHTDQPIILVCDSYLEDKIKEKMIITVYGEVIEPSITEEPIPRLHTEYISYQKKIYRK